MPCTEAITCLTPSDTNLTTRRTPKISRNTQIFEQLQKALDDLSSMILDVDELVKFLTSYPRLYCEPYSMHLQLANCMFGRQMEAELVINFLLHTQPHGAVQLEVLPIVGPGNVDDELATFRGRYAVKHQSRVSNSTKNKRFLVVVELVGDLNEDAWNRLYSASKQCMSRGSKIIVTSRSDKIIKFGTARALILKYLSHEAYWYFFKTLTFGSMDAEMHPRLAHLAMGISRTLNSSLIGANITALMLRDNFDIHFWCKVLAFLRGSFQKHISKFGGHPIDLMNENRPTHFGRMATPSEELMVYHKYERSSQEEVPKIKIQDVMYGSVKLHGKFEILGWRSHLPPYYSHVYSCEIPELKAIAAKRKRSMKSGVTIC